MELETKRNVILVNLTNVKTQTQNTEMSSYVFDLFFKVIKKINRCQDCRRNALN